MREHQPALVERALEHAAVDAGLRRDRHRALVDLDDLVQRAQVDDQPAVDRHRAALGAGAAAPGDDRHVVGGRDAQRGGDVVLACAGPRRRPGGPAACRSRARRDRRPIRVGGVGVKLCVLGVDRVRTEDRGERGRKLDQLRNRRLHLLTTELALPFNCCQGHDEDSSKLVTRRRRHRRRNVRGEGHRGRRRRRGPRAPRSRRTRSRRRRPGWSEQNPDDWWEATEQALDGLTDGVAGIGLSGQMHGLVTLDAQRPPDPARDPLERPAHRRRVRRDRGARRLRPARRADRQPRADGLHGAEAAVAAQARAGRLRADRARDAAQGLRAAAAHRRARDRRRRRLGHAAARRRAAALERRGARHPRDRPRRGCRPCSSRRRSPAARPAASRSPRARATRPRAGSASASTGRGRCRSRWARPASSSPRCPSTAPTRRPASTPSATPCPAPGTRWA